MRDSNNRAEDRSPWSLWLLLNLSCIVASIGGCGGGSDSSSPYGSTLVVKYYSDSQCTSEAPIPGSRFSISSSGEGACKKNQAYKHVGLSFDPLAVSCDPTNPTSCGIENGASVEWRGECNENCTQCAKATSSDETSALGDCLEILPGGNAKGSGGYLRATTSAYTGALYVGVSEKNGASIKMYDPEALESVYLDTSGADKNYPISLAVSQSDLANGNSNVLYAALNGSNILWQCQDTQENSCGTWNTTPERPNAFVAGDPGFMYVGMKSGVIWRCPTNAANACITYATLPPNTQNPTSISSLAYDPGSNTLYAGTGCQSCDTNFIYSVPLGQTDPAPQLFSSIDVDTSSNCTVEIVDLEYGAGKIWATQAASCVNSQGSYEYGGGLVSCDLSGACTGEFGGTSWGVAYDPDDNLVFTSQVSHGDFSNANGAIQVLSVASGEVGTPIDIGSLGDGFTSDNLSSPGFPPNALLYAGGYLYFGTGNCDSASCNSLFRCPVGATTGACVQVQLNCDSVSSCKGAQSLAYIADVNYPTE
jgi:hypothetical protein